MRSILLFLFLILLSTNTQALTLTNQGNVFKFPEKPIYYKEPRGIKTDEILKRLISGKVTTLKSVENLGYAEGAYWTVKKVVNTSKDTDWVLHFSDPLVEKLSLYVVGDTVQHQTADFSTRSTFNNILPSGLIFHIKLQTDKPTLLLIRSDVNVYDQTAALKLIRGSFFNTWAMQNSLIYLLVLGGMIGLTLYSFLLFALLKDASYGLYCAFATTVLILLLNLYGYFYPLFGFEHIDRRYDYTVFSMITFSALIFVYRLLDVKQMSVRLSRIVWISGIVIFISLVIAFSLGAVVYAEVAGITHFYVILLSITLSIIGIRRGRPASWFLLLAWTPLALILMLAIWNIVFSYVGAVSYDIELVANIAIFVQLLIFLLAVVSKINIYQKEKIQAENANLEKSRFIAAASHDLRQPLHALGLFFDALKQSTTLKERESLFSSIGYSIKSLSELLNALLDISKLDANAIEYRLQAVSINKVIQNIVREYEAEAHTKGIQIRTRPCRHVVNTDPLWLERIMRNLIGNALRYTKSGCILIGCRKKQDHIVLQVWDTGIGIPADQLKNIFIEFLQLNNPQRDRSKGLGLGLAIVKRICNLLGHQIKVESTPGKGTVFSLTMQISHEQPIEQEGDSSQSTNKLKGKTILLIDDEMQVNHAMSVLLDKWECKAITAISAQVAQEKLANEKLQPDIIISDFRLADHKTGIEAIRSLKQYLGRDVPALLVTGDTSPDKLSEIKQSGYKLLHKPVKPAQLRIMLNSLCQ